jgi:signal transduction histidine kinase
VALYEAGRALWGTLRQDELTQLVSGLAERALGAERVALLLSADDRTGRQVRWGGNDSQPPIELVERLAARADRESRPLQWPSPDVSDELFGHRDLRWGSALVFPLSVSACSLGSLVLLRASSRAPFSRSELARGALFANLLAVALQNARLYGDLEKRVRELMATRDELVQAERLAMAGRMAGYVAHEISSPLAAIELNLSTLKGYSRPVERLWVASGELAQHLLERRGPASRSLALNMLHAGGSRERTEKLIRGFTPLLDTMLEGTRRIASLVTSFRGLGGLAEKGVVERFEIDDLLDEVVTLASQSAGSKNLRIVREASPALHGFGVRADLRHALMNLLIFLSQEPPSDRERPRAATVGASMIGDRPSLWVHGRNLELTGAQRAHLFDFVEHKDEVKGDLRTQIGLSLAFELVQRSGGTLSAEPSARGGTLFRVVLAGEEPRT